MKNRFVIWGDGDKAKRLLFHLGNSRVSAFISDNKKRVCLGKPVITLEEYERNYGDLIIIASPILEEDNIINKLEQKGIKNYLSITNCPGEFNEPYPRNNLKNYIKSLCYDKNKIAIFGINIYSLLMYDWIKEISNAEIILIENTQINTFVSEYLKAFYPIYKTDTISEIDNISKYIVLNTTEDTVTGFPYEKIYDVFDCSDSISTYHNLAIEKFKNIHKNENCVIVATGPSISYEDLDLLNRYEIITISMNRIWTAYEKTTWRPTYYVVQDHRYIKEDLQILDQLTSEAVFVADTNDDYCKNVHPNNHFLFHTQFEYKMNSLPKFSSDFSRKNYNGATVTYTCLQLAAYMGFKNIFLLGVDFNILGNYTDSQNHFTQNYFHSGEKFPGFFRDANLMAFKSAKKYAERNKINIYNATRGGYLEVFERRNLEDLIKIEYNEDQYK